MRLVWLLLVLNLSVFADYLVRDGSNGYCASSYGFSGGTLYYVSSSDGGTYQALNLIAIDTGYVYDTNSSICIKNPVLEQWGTTFEGMNFLLALAGLLAGFEFLFFASFLVIKIAGR